MKRRLAGANLESDPQGLVLASLNFVDAKHVRLGVQVMFGIVVELGASLVSICGARKRAVAVKPLAQAPMGRPKSKR